MGRGSAERHVSP